MSAELSKRIHTRHFTWMTANVLANQLTELNLNGAKRANNSPAQALIFIQILFCRHASSARLWSDLQPNWLRWVTCSAITFFSNLWQGVKVAYPCKCPCSLPSRCMEWRAVMPLLCSQLPVSRTNWTKWSRSWEKCL